MNEFEMIDEVSDRVDQVGNPLDQMTREDVAKMARKLAINIENNPLFGQYISHINRSHTQLNTEPWHAMGERLNAAWVLLHAMLPENKIPVQGIRHGPYSQNVLGLAQIVMRATPYLWSDKMEKLADAAPLPKHVVNRNIMPHPVMFWSRESAYVSEEGDNNWICVFYTSGQRIVIVGDISNKEGTKKEIIVGHITLGHTWPTDYNNDQYVGRVLKRCAFLNSPYIDQESHRLQRHHRRQLDRAGFAEKQIEERIHVVKLRHRVVAGEHKQTPHEATEWKHKWWVSGHYRAQWYPSEKAHQVIWIAPYLKGPEDAPLLEKIYSVER
jgi:hypothetical protein